MRSTLLLFVTAALLAASSFASPLVQAGDQALDPRGGTPGEKLKTTGSALRARQNTKESQKNGRSVLPGGTLHGSRHEECVVERCERGRLG